MWERIWRPNTPSPGAKNSMDPGFKKSGVEKLKPSEWDLMVYSPKYVLISISAGIKGQFFSSGFRNKFLHCSFVRDGFHNRKQLSCTPVDRKNNRGRIKAGRKTGVAKEMKNNWKQHLTMAITYLHKVRCGVKAMGKERAWKKTTRLAYIAEHVYLVDC